MTSNIFSKKKQNENNGFSAPKAWNIIGAPCTNFTVFEGY